MAEETAPPLADLVPGAPHPAATHRLFGQEAAESRFLAAWRADRLHHAWLLRGPEGIGKATLAYRIARALIAEPAEAGLFGAPEPPETLDAPPDCPVRARILAGAEPQLRVLRRGLNDRGKLRTEIVVEDVRALKGFLQMSLPDGGRRVVIVDSADELNRAAANAFLKNLEEPPARTVMLLVSHNPGGLLPTIRSRCRLLDLDPLGPDALAAALDEAGAAPPEAAAALAELAGGSVGRALRLMAGEGLALYARMAGLIGHHGVDRERLMALAAHAGARGAGETYDLHADLLHLLLARLARHAAGRPIDAEAAPGERALSDRLAALPGAAREIAEASARVSLTLRHARAVNLDPAQTIIDTWLDIDDALARLAASAPAT